MPKNYLKPIAPHIHVELEEQEFSLIAGGNGKSGTDTVLESLQFLNVIISSLHLLKLPKNSTQKCLKVLSALPTLSED